MNNKKIKTALVAAMLTSTMAYNIPAINATTLTQKSVDNPVLVPTPKKVTYEENILSITNSVNIKGKDVADTDAVRELTEFLESNSITVNDDYQEGSTTIIIGEEDDEVDDGEDGAGDEVPHPDSALLVDLALLGARSLGLAHVSILSRGPASTGRPSRIVSSGLAPRFPF